jgi:DNA-binding NarL/FixJ family response regulator
MTDGAEPAITCVVADDHPPVREFLSRYLAGRGLTVTASTCDGEEALGKIRETAPDVAVLDVRMPLLSGVDVARAVAEERLSTRVVLYTGYGETALLREAIDVGVAALLEKDSPLDELVRAIRVAAEGRVYVDPGLGARLLAEADEPPLTPREREVLTLLADGLANEAIAERLGISAQTVRTHLQKSMARLGASTRTEAVATALRRSLIR